MLSVCCCNFYRENDKIGTRTGVNTVSVDRQAIQKSSFVSMRIVGSSGVNHFLNSQLIDRGIAISIFMDLGQYKTIVPFESAKEIKTTFFSTCHGTSATYTSIYIVIIKIIRNVLILNEQVSQTLLFIRMNKNEYLKMIFFTSLVKCHACDD
jgi:hypothetical protein